MALDEERAALGVEAECQQASRHLAGLAAESIGVFEIVAKRAARALETLDIKPNFLFSNGGLDANWLDKHGVPTITIGAGQAEIHTVKEYVNLGEYEKGCRIAIKMATLED